MTPLKTKEMQELTDLSLKLNQFYRKNKHKLKTPVKAKHFLVSLSHITNLYCPINDNPTVKGWRFERILKSFFTLKQEKKDVR